jgi:hypothetical protein
MSEFAPICIYFLISLLVSWVLLGLIFASNSSTHALFRKRGIPFLFVATLVLFCYLVVLLVGLDFHLLFSQMESLILRKGLSFFLQRVGWEVGRFLAIILALFDVESPTISNMMTPSGASGASSSGNWRQYLNFSSGNEGDSAPEQSTSSTWSGSWIGRWFNQEVAPNEGGHETTSKPTGTGVMEQEQAGPSGGEPIIPPILPQSQRDEETGSPIWGALSPVERLPSLDGPSNPPSNPRGDEAGPSNQPLPVEPYPYAEDSVIGGDSLASIRYRILAREVNPSSERIQWAQMEAEDLFEVKVHIIRSMTLLDPEGDWERRGALALHNPRTATGEEPLERLYALHEDLSSKGRQSEAFHSLKERVFRR